MGFLDRWLDEPDQPPQAHRRQAKQAWTVGTLLMASGLTMVLVDTVLDALRASDGSDPPAPMLLVALGILQMVAAYDHRRRWLDARRAQRQVE